MMEDPQAVLARTAATACARVCADLEGVARDLGASGAREDLRKVLRVVGALERAEGAPLEPLTRAVAEAADGLAGLLGDLQSRASASELDPALECLAKSMVTLHPLRRALESALAVEPAAMPLVRPKKRRAVLELVPDADDPRPPAERRDRDRVALEVDIGMRSETNFFAGFGDDVSEGGIFVATYDRLPIGTELTLSFVLPSGAQVVVRGRVAWLREGSGFDSEFHPGMGVSFADLDEAGRAAIREYMQHREPIFYER